MKTLYISRHAEAEPDLNTDFSRCLTMEGEQEADWLGKYLLKHDVKIDIVLSSSAKRALSTANIVIQQAQLPPENLIIIPELYNAKLETLLEMIRTLDNKYTHPLLVAHNPGLSNLAHYLIDADVGHLPTCGFCGFNLTIESWDELQKGIGQLMLMSYPGAL
ncbi:MAG: hypothetical protein LEGION0398_MBIBDBAK_00628 [Legionellaceae bacterium]